LLLETCAPKAKDVPSSQDVVSGDLTYIGENLREEFGRMAGKNLLIVGGGGFLGYYLVQSVLQWNHGRRGPDQVRLTVYDNFIRGVPAWLTRLQAGGGVRLERHDIREPLPARAGDFHYLVHAASIASPAYYRKYPIETIDANVTGFRNLLEYCRRQQEVGRPVEGLLFFSSSEIYGDPTPENIPTPETYRGNVSCTGPRACYDEAKRFCETLCVNFTAQLGLPVKIARPFNNYGPGLKITDRRVLPDFARDIFAGRDLVLLSDGSPTRTFCYVADAVVGYYKVLVKGRKGEAYNIGVETPEISVAGVAERMARLARELFGYTGKVVHRPSADADYLVDNPQRRCPVLTKARTELGYQPTISLDEGLKRLLIWYHDHREGEEA
jgi:nucleoside-diphosphate-sugar epimerase